MNEEFFESLHEFRMYVMGQFKIINEQINLLYSIVENLERKEEAAKSIMEEKSHE